MNANPSATAAHGRQKADRKSGIRRARRREAKRIVRDRKIYKFLWVTKKASEMLHRLRGEPLEPLSVYAGKPEIPNSPKLTFFPLAKQPNGKPMPHWNDLSAWLKAQLAVLAMDQWERKFLTFNIHIHPELEDLWISEGRDVRIMMRDRLRRELDRISKQMEHFFVIEGWSKRDRSPTMLHIHGAALIRNPGEEKRVKLAAARAAGHLQGRVSMNRAVHVAPFTREGPKYIEYLFKSVRRADERLPERRLTMSRGITQGTREFWNMITDCSE